MNEFKSKTIIPDYVIRIKSKARPVFPVSKSLKFLLLNERIQIKNDYSWLCNLYETKWRYSHSCIWKPEVSTFKWNNSNWKGTIWLCNPYETEVESFPYLSSLYAVACAQTPSPRYKKKFFLNQESLSSFLKETYYEEFTLEEQRNLTWLYTAEKIISVMYSYLH